MSKKEIEITDEIRRDVEWANSFELMSPKGAISMMISGHAKSLLASGYRIFEIEKIEHWARVLIIQEDMEATKKELLSK